MPETGARNGGRIAGERAGRHRSFARTDGELRSSFTGGRVTWSKVPLQYTARRGLSSRGPKVPPLHRPTHIARCTARRLALTAPGGARAPRPAPRRLEASRRLRLACGRSRPWAGADPDLLPAGCWPPATLSLRGTRERPAGAPTRPDGPRAGPGLEEHPGARGDGCLGPRLSARRGRWPRPAAGAAGPSGSPGRFSWRATRCRPPAGSPASWWASPPSESCC